MLSWLAINRKKIVDFTLTDALFGKFDIVEVVMILQLTHSSACKVLNLLV